MLDVIMLSVVAPKKWVILLQKSFIGSTPESNDKKFISCTVLKYDEKMLQLEKGLAYETDREMFSLVNALQEVL